MTSVSVVIPAYNAAETIDATLASVVAQTRQPDEVVVVDDGSTDATAATVEAWAGRLPIRLLRNETNRGLGFTRTCGTLAATSELVAPLDSDDFWLPDHLALLTPLVRDARTIAGARRLRWIPGSGLGPADDPVIPRPDRQRTAILRANWMFGNSVFARDSFERVQPREPARCVDDWQTWIHLIALGGCRVVPAPHATVLYRSSDRQMSADLGSLLDEIAMCDQLLGDPRFADVHSSIRNARRRRSARVDLLTGLQLAADGQTGAARRRFVAAALMDRSLRGGLRPTPIGSVTLRATAALASPGQATRHRHRRLSAQALIPANDSRPPANRLDNRKG